MAAAPSFPRATSQATAARVKYLVFEVFDIDENVSEGVNCFECVKNGWKSFMHLNRRNPG